MFGTLLRRDAFVGGRQLFQRHRGTLKHDFVLEAHEAFEQRFAHDEELKFKATARRNKLLGLWAAEKLGLTGAEADSYALSVVMVELEDSGDHDVAGKIRKDFAAKGVQQSDHQIARTMTELMAKAVADIQAGK